MQSGLSYNRRSEAKRYESPEEEGALYLAWKVSFPRSTRSLLERQVEVSKAKKEAKGILSRGNGPMHGGESQK